MIETAPGIEALLGRVQVEVVGCAATFEIKSGHPTVKGNGPHPTGAEIAFPGGTIGRGSQDDLQVVGPDSREASRGHLLIQPSGRQWTVVDCESKNLTYEEDPENGGWRPLPSGFPIPVTDEMALCLGDRLRLRFKLSYPQLVEETTTPGSGRPASAARIRPFNLEQLAAALLAPRRKDRYERRVANNAELANALEAEGLANKRATIQRKLRLLAELPEVEVPPGDRRALADALERAFPYLIAPGPDRS